MSSQQERAKRVQVRLSEDMFSRLGDISLAMGMPYSTVASVAISEYVLRKEREAAMASSSNQMLGDFMGKLENLLKEETER